ncbi:MAG TPA: AraC family transcriptional regulator [Thermoanaerobaculia bacterium]
MDRRVRKTLEYLEVTGYGHTRTAELAGRVGLSGSRLGHVFKAQLGISIRDFVRRKRLALAAELVAETDLPIAHIVELSGFPDHANFDHAFKREFGVAPREFRKACE